MPHQPNCPYQRLREQCAYTCQESAHGRPALVRSPYSTPPPYSPMDPIKAGLLIKEHFERAKERFKSLAPRRVHFEPVGRSDRRSSTSSVYEERYDGKSSSYTAMPPRSILRPSPAPPQPTIYIVTFSTDITPNRSRPVKSLLASQLPSRSPPIPHLYTIDASRMTPPSARLCSHYSGISPVIQDVVMQDRAARRAVKDAVQELLEFGRREKRGRGREREVALSVCCLAGTHRSVAIGERIAQGVKNEVRRMGVQEGVVVVVRHVHRVKGRGDPF